MARRVKDLLDQRAVESFVGRTDELRILRDAVEFGGPAVVFVHGIGGIGKSSLLSTFATLARAEGATVIHLDCRSIEPTERGFLGELAAAVGVDTPTVDEITRRLDSIGGPVVIALDAYEVFRFMDTWLRQVFVPALGENTRVLLFGREAPVSAWQTSPGWQGLVRSVRLGPLSERDATALLNQAGVREENVAWVNRVTRGHPLALKLASAALAERLDRNLEDLAAQRVVAELTRMYLEDVREPLTREVVEAASVVRRTTHSLLRAMLPQAAPQDAFERLRALPFVESSRDGLLVHDLVQQSVATALRATDPSRHHGYRLAAWRQLRAESRAVSQTELWRYTADMLYILQNPLIREAFFPSDVHRYAIEPARPDDSLVVEAIIERHEGPAAARQLRAWWKQAPQDFRVLRDPDGSVAGFYVLLDLPTVPAAMHREDEIFARFAHHLRRDSVARQERVLYCRRWLSLTHGEEPSPVQAASWLDIKGTCYMHLRPHLRRIYMTVRDVATYGPVASDLGFKLVPEASVEQDGVTYHLAMLDLGPLSIDGWLAAKVAAELGVEEENLLDLESRELIVDGERIKLAPLEFKVMAYLGQHEGKAVARASLLTDVWGYDYDGGSNVVDVVIRSLRKKLGSRASLIETVTGAGYRLRKE
jgi:hypothetical protein